MSKFGQEKRALVEKVMSQERESREKNPQPRGRNTVGTA